MEGKGNAQSEFKKANDALQAFDSVAAKIVDAQKDVQKMASVFRSIAGPMEEIDKIFDNAVMRTVMEVSSFLRKFIPGLSQLEDLISDLVGEVIKPIENAIVSNIKDVVGEPHEKLKKLQTDFDAKREQLERFQRLGKEEVSPFEDRKKFLEREWGNIKGATVGAAEAEINNRKDAAMQQITSCFKPHTAE